ncbi:MAG: metal ABC transporter ATP-binding protein [Promethearchaeota archaeon]
MADQGEIEIEFDGVSVKLGGNTILNNINLKITRGEYIGLIGKNGSGKSTLLKTLLGIIKPFQGKVFIRGKPVWKMQHNLISYVPQMHPTNREFPAKVKDVVGMGLYGANFFGWNPHITRQERKERIMLALHKVNMESYLNRPIGHLSGGELQKVLLAHALVRNPSILLLDEPTSALDFTMVRDFLELLDRLNKKFNITLLVIQHNLEMLRPVVSRLIMLRRSILYDGAPEIEKADEMIRRVFYS